MKIKYLLVVGLLFLSSCATRYVEKSESDKIAIDMTSFNYRMSGYLFRNEMKGNLSGLKSDKYIQLIQSQANPSEIKYVSFVLNEKPELSLSAKDDDFVVCIRLVAKRFGLCDKASTNFVDRYLISEEMSLDLEQMSSGLIN
jgi:hypothetical protein